MQDSQVHVVFSVCLDLLDLMVIPEVQESQDHQVNLERTGNQAARETLDQQEHLELQDFQDPKGHQDCQDHQGHQEQKEKL